MLRSTQRCSTRSRRSSGAPPRHSRLPLAARTAGATRYAPAHPRGSGNRLLLSAASSWEIAIKVRLGRLVLPDDPKRYVPDRMRAIGAEPLAVEHAHALAVADLPALHRDPFDRMLVAQAGHLGMTIVTAGLDVVRYDVRTILV